MTNARELVLDNRGILLKGVFFRLSCASGQRQLTADSAKEMTESFGYTFVNGNEPTDKIITELVVIDYIDSNDPYCFRASVQCKSNACYDRKSYDRIPATITYSPQEYSAVMNSADGIFAVRQDVHETLVKEMFRGYCGIQIETERDSRDIDRPEIYFVKKDGMKLIRQEIVIPDRISKCQFCGVGELFCQDCHRTLGSCTGCGRSMAQLLKRQGSPEQIRRHLTYSDVILDLAEWNGDDVLGWTTDLFVSKRFLNFLLSRHYGPLIYTSVLVDVSNLNHQQREWLREVQG